MNLYEHNLRVAYNTKKWHGMHVIKKWQGARFEKCYGQFRGVFRGPCAYIRRASVRVTAYRKLREIGGCLLLEACRKVAMQNRMVTSLMMSRDPRTSQQLCQRWGSPPTRAHECTTVRLNSASMHGKIRPWWPLMSRFHYFYILLKSQTALKQVLSKSATCRQVTSYRQVDHKKSLKLVARQ